VYALDLPGFGKSDKEIEDFSLDYAAAFLARFMDAVGIERASLAGNSLGGVVCAQTAVQFPERVSNLVLVGSAGFGRELSPYLRLWSVPVLGDLAFRTYQGLFPMLKRWVFRSPQSIGDEWFSETAAVLRSEAVRKNALKVARMGVTLRGQRQELLGELHRELAVMEAPTLIIWGRDDPAVPLSHAYHARDLIPNSEVRVMERCGHLPQVERPDELNELVLDFLSASLRAEPTEETR
jgi:4,5:9,10-diseco-3-hydroxy-5,9,17-trioxoandrosta-1(10),2-diene-4-oate hydrolase